ncbi:hypothetical protein N7451_007260 [Penicillium sp. IBT 35674x]|nr:hypothetical protein N7451_007260 [Penicillium sp. IBT 35674x]
MSSLPDMFQFASLSVRHLPLAEIETQFHLTHVNTTDWTRFQTPFQMSDEMGSYLTGIDTSIENEGIRQIALRCRFHSILCSVYCVAPKDPRYPDLTKIPVSGKWSFFFEPIIYNGEMRCLRGCPDYLIWYHPDAETEDLAINLVILQPKEGHSLRCVPQTLAYMAMIHTQRRYEERIEHTIFGLSTDGIQFHFLQIDCKGEWSQLGLHYPSHRQEILNTLAYIHRHASILSSLPCNGREQSYSESQVEGALLATQGAQSRSLPAETYSMLQIEDPFSDDSDSDGTMILTFGGD